MNIGSEYILKLSLHFATIIMQYQDEIQSQVSYP